MSDRSPGVLRVILLGIFALVVMLLVYGAGRYLWTSTQLARKIAALRAAGDPVTASELRFSDELSADDAGYFLRLGAADISAIEREVNEVYEAASNADQNAFDAGLATPELLAAIKAALAAHPDALPAIEAAAARRLAPQVTGSTPDEIGSQIFDELTQLRSAARVLRYRALAQLADGQQAAALDTTLAMLRMSRQVEGDTMLIGFLVGVALRGSAVRTANQVLRAGPLTREQHMALDAELARHNLAAAYRQAMRSERAMGLDMYRTLPFVLSWLTKQDQADYLDLMAGEIAATRDPNWDRMDTSLVTAIGARAGALTAGIAPAITAARDALTRSEAELRALRVLNAITQIEQETPQATISLEGLGLPAEVLLDPYNGQPLVVQKLPEGWVVYSVGRDQVDNGGLRLGGTNGEDAGVGPVVRPPASDDDDEAAAAEVSGAVGAGNE